MAAQSANNTTGERSAIDYDRARFGEQRDVWGSENTKPRTSADMSATYVQRLRNGHDWVGVDKESIVHENDGMTTRVTLTHWKDHRISSDAERAVNLRDESQVLSHKWVETKTEVMTIEHNKAEVYDALCVEKYSNSDLQSECIRLEAVTREERARGIKIEDFTKKVAAEVQVEGQLTKEMRQRADFLEKTRMERFKDRESLKCCARCCTACCWLDRSNGCTAFFIYTCPLLMGLSLPCRCGSLWCCGPDVCCQKERVLRSLDPDTAIQEWDKQLKRIKREEMERMLNDMFL